MEEVSKESLEELAMRRFREKEKERRLRDRGRNCMKCVRTNCIGCEYHYKAGKWK